MRDRFELFTMSVTRAYKYIQQIKKHESATFGIKGIHVMCMVALGKYPEGLTVTELAASCCEDKAAISRTVDSLAEKGYIVYEEAQARRRWRSKIMLTGSGPRDHKGPGGTNPMRSWERSRTTSRQSRRRPFTGFFQASTTGSPSTARCWRTGNSIG